MTTGQVELLEEGAAPEGDATLEDGAMPEDCALPDVNVALEDGTMAEEGLRVKLAESFVRKPVDAPVPVG